MAKREEHFDQGYEIDRAYAMADRYAVGSDRWHYWMDRAKEAENKARGPVETPWNTLIPAGAKWR